MTPEKEFRKEIWLLMQDIKAKMLRAPKGTEITFEIKSGTTKKPSPLAMLMKLNKMGVLKDKWVLYKKTTSLKMVKEVILTINKSKFDLLYEKLKYEFSPKIHTHIIEKEVLVERLIDPITIDKAKYKGGILYFGERKINFNGRKVNQKDLLTTLFKTPAKNWRYEEVQDDWDETEIGKIKYPKKYWKKFCNAGDDINHAVMEVTQIKNFIIKNANSAGNIRLNPKYI